jgi:hypothetical protein
LHRQQQEHDNSYCGERLANGDSGAVAEPIADPSAGKLSGGAADKDQRQCESRSRDSRPLSDQQEWEAHKKAASHDAVCDAEQDENAKAELPRSITFAALTEGKLGGGRIAKFKPNSACQIGRATQTRSV